MYINLIPFFVLLSVKKYPNDSQVFLSVSFSHPLHRLFLIHEFGLSPFEKLIAVQFQEKFGLSSGGYQSIENRKPYSTMVFC